MMYVMQTSKVPIHFSHMIAIPNYFYHSTRVNSG